MTRTDTAAERVQRYVDAHHAEAAIKQHADCIVFTIDDLRELLAELKRAKERCWSICTGNEFHGRVFEYRADCLECGMTRADYERVLNPPEVGT